MGRRLVAGIVLVAALLALLANEPGVASVPPGPSGTFAVTGAGSPPPLVTIGPLGSRSPVPTLLTPTPGPVALPRPTRDFSVPAPIPPGLGKLFRKDFSDGRLKPFRVLLYPNDHPGDLMIRFGRFVDDRSHVSVHDGYLDLRATRNADGSWSQALVGTGMDGRGNPATFAFRYGTARVMARMNNGVGAWPTLWYLVADSWDTVEIDWGEIIHGVVRAHVHWPGIGKVIDLPAPPADEWHEYAMTKTPTYVSFALDGVEVARTAVAIPSRMALFADAKIGLDRPDATTPSPVFMNVAWWIVDPLPAAPAAQ